MFDGNFYRLPHAALKRLTRDDAMLLAPELAAIDPWRRLGYRAAALTDYLLRPDPSLHRFSLTRQGEMAGLVAVRQPWLLGPYLEMAAVLPDFQGQGLGRQFMEWLEAHAFASHRNLWALTSSFNERARRFYAKQGFVEVCALPGLVRAECDEILLRKQRPVEEERAGA